MRQPNLSATIATELRALISGGRLPTGQRVNETALAEQLDVSRTPLREALSRLASEGFVESRARQGFFVQTLRPSEVEELYAIRVILDPAALELAGLPDGDQLRRLVELNERIVESDGQPARTVELDEAWHAMLLEHCPNGTLLGLIRQFMLRTRPLELEYMAEHGNVVTVVREHRAILERLEGGELGAAVDALRENMTTAVPVLTEWVRQRIAVGGGEIRV